MTDDWLNSYAVPWKELVPLRVIRLALPPPAWPKAASESKAFTRTSWTASSGGLYAEAPPEVVFAAIEAEVTELALGAPFSRNSFDPPMPPMMKPPPGRSNGRTGPG